MNQTIKFYGVVFIIKFISCSFQFFFSFFYLKIAVNLFFPLFQKNCIHTILFNDVKLQISRILKACAFLCVEVFWLIDHLAAHNKQQLAFAWSHTKPVDFFSFSFLPYPHSLFHSMLSRQQRRPISRSNIKVYDCREICYEYMCTVVGC